MRYITSRLTYYVNVNVNQEFLAWLKQPKPTTYLLTVNICCTRQLASKLQCIVA